MARNGLSIQRVLELFPNADGFLCSSYIPGCVISPPHVVAALYATYISIAAFNVPMNIIARFMDIYPSLTR